MQHHQVKLLPLFWQLGGHFDDWDHLSVFTNQWGKLGVVIDYDVQDHLLVCGVVGVSMHLPKPSGGMKLELYKAVDCLSTDRFSENLDQLQN